MRALTDPRIDRCHSRERHAARLTQGALDSLAGIPIVDGRFVADLGVWSLSHAQELLRAAIEALQEETA